MSGDKPKASKEKREAYKKFLDAYKEAVEKSQDYPTPVEGLRPVVESRQRSREILGVTFFESRQISVFMEKHLTKEGDVWEPNFWRAVYEVQVVFLQRDLEKFGLESMRNFKSNTEQELNQLNRKEALDDSRRERVGPELAALYQELNEFKRQPSLSEMDQVMMKETQDSINLLEGQMGSGDDEKTMWWRSYHDYKNGLPKVEMGPEELDTAILDAKSQINFVEKSDAYKTLKSRLEESRDFLDMWNNVIKLNNLNN